MTWGAAVIVIAAAAALAYVYRRDHGRIVAKRGRAFQRCMSVLDRPDLKQDGPDYPKLNGQRNGCPVSLELIADHVNFRKLPPLWLSVTVRKPLPVSGICDIMMRPQNTEFFSPHGELTETVPTPSTWPDTAVIRCDKPASARLMANRLSEHAEFFESDKNAKELIVSPNGVRLVYMVDQAQRSHYLVLRHPIYENDVVEPELVEDLIERVFSIVEELRAGELEVASK